MCEDMCVYFLRVVVQVAGLISPIQHPLSSFLAPTMRAHWVRSERRNVNILTLTFQVGLMLIVDCGLIVSNILPENPHLDNNHLAETHEGRRGKILDNLIDFSGALMDEETGLKCVRTEETLETVEREKLLSCTHSSINICHYTYVTKFRSSRQEVCEDIYTKNCNIVFSKQAKNESLEHCYYPLVMECDDTGVGEKTCRQFTESSCVTRYQSDSASQPVTECQKIPVELCGAQSCAPRPGERSCHSKVVTRVDETPEESCDIVPSKICRTVSQLVPHLVPVEKCSDLPRQICSFGLLSPKVSEKPLVTKWCFDPSEEADEDYEDNPPDLTPFVVEDVLVFQDNINTKTNEELDVRSGKDIDVSKDVTNYIDDGDDRNLISSPPDQTDFQEENSRTDNPLRNYPDNLGQSEILEKSRKNNSITENFDDEDYTDEGQELDEEISAILTKLNSDFRSKISVEKADGIDDNDEKRLTAVAKIIKHKDTPGRHTILIKNTAEARKLFGIKNGASPGNNNDAGLQEADIGPSNAPALDLQSKNDETAARAAGPADMEQQSLRIRQSEKENNNRGELNTNLIELQNHLEIQTRKESGINSVDNPSPSRAPPGQFSLLLLTKTTFHIQFTMYILQAVY